MPFLAEELNEILVNFREQYENAIRNHTTINLIRSQALINLFHEFVKLEFIDRGIDPNKIYPPLNNSSPEKRITGFLKGKNQDVSIFPSYPREPELIRKGAAIGKTDSYGEDFLEKTLTVNVRSQLSSVKKNFDTLYERSFAEPLNLHLRIPLMVLGELYLIPTVAYDSNGIKEGYISRNENNYLLTFISSYIALNMRRNIESDFHKYERMCLLIVDFSENPPNIVDNFTELRNHLTDNENNILSNFNNSEIEELRNNFQNLTINNFIDDLLETYDLRHNLDYLL